MKVLRSIGAVVVGFLVIAVLSTAVDSILEGSGVLPKDTLVIEGSQLIVVAVVAYRALFSLLGCYVAARLAPGSPMKHAITLGVLGMVFTILGSAAMSDVQPAWFGITLAVISLPIAWLGGKLYERTSR